MTFLYVTDSTQLAYSPTREAVAEWWRFGDRWRFMGWLWDGKLRTLADARTEVREYVKVWG